MTAPRDPTAKPWERLARDKAADADVAQDRSCVLADARRRMRRIADMRADRRAATLARKLGELAREEAAEAGRLAQAVIDEVGER